MKNISKWILLVIVAFAVCVPALMADETEQPTTVSWTLSPASPVTMPIQTTELGENERASLQNELRVVPETTGLSGVYLRTTMEVKVEGRGSKASSKEVRIGDYAGPLEIVPEGRKSIKIYDSSGKQFEPQIVPKTGMLLEDAGGVENNPLPLPTQPQSVMNWGIDRWAQQFLVSCWSISGGREGNCISCQFAYDDGENCIDTICTDLSTGETCWGEIHRLQDDDGPIIVSPG